MGYLWFLCMLKSRVTDISRAPMPQTWVALCCLFHCTTLCSKRLSATPVSGGYRETAPILLSVPRFFLSFSVFPPLLQVLLLGGGEYRVGVWEDGAEEEASSFVSPIHSTSPRLNHFSRASLPLPEAWSPCGPKSLGLHTVGPSYWRVVPHLP